MLLPLTAPMPVPGATLGKGVVILLTKESDESVSARIVAFVAAYSALGVRDPAMDEPIGKALTAGPGRWQAVRRLRRDRHDPDGSCWLHRDGCCFSAM